jgi:GDSL-like Lipase/Acylhydrolase family
MKRVIPWIIAAVAVVAFGASFSELQRMRGRFGEVSRHQAHNHLHFEVREFSIRAALQDSERPIVVLGDSITEMARLPETIDGKPVVNAGIGGASIEDFQRVGPDLLQNAKPSLIAVALCTNEAGSNTIRQAYAALLKKLKQFSPRLLAVAVPPQDGADLINAQIKAAAESEGVPFLEMPLPEGSTLADRIHLNAAGYRKWTPAIVAAISGHTS